jgi:hypothetical protein
MRPLLLALLASLLLPASAPAALDGGGKITHDDQWSRFTLPVTCDEPAGCTTTVAISYQFLGRYPDFKPLGAPVQADSKAVTVPAGSSELALETGEVIKGLARQGGAFHVIFEAGGARLGQTFGNYDKVGGCDGRSPLVMPFGGKGSLYYRAPKDDTFDRVSGPVTRSTFMTQSSDYEVRGGTVTYSYKGVTYTFAKGARFSMTCTGNTDVAGGAGVLSPFLKAGKVSVRADRSEMKQPAAWIVTSEGNLGTRAKETTLFTVTRRSSRSTLSVKKGANGTITPWNSRTRSPCRAGQRLTVDRKGVIT